MAGTTGLEPATSAVTGQRSNQLSYVPTSALNTLVVRNIESSVSQTSLFSLASNAACPRFLAFYIGTKQTPKTQNRRRNDNIESTR